MDVAVANRHWTTAGGGEVYALAVADALAARGHRVTILAPEGVDWPGVESRLGGASRAEGPGSYGIEEVDFDDSSSLSRSGSRFDLFVNTSHGTQEPNPGRLGLLLVHFPRDHLADLGALRPAARALLRAGLVGPPRFTFGPGFHADGADSRTLRWTKGTGTLIVHGPPGDRVEVLLVFGNDRPDPTEAVVGTDASSKAVRVTPDSARHFARVDVPLDADGTGHVTVTSDTFVPAETGSSDDRRVLGVPVVGVRVGDTLRDRVAFRSSVVSGARRLRFAHTYDAVVCNSPYTRDWIRTWWRLRADVVHPAVSARPPRPQGEKEHVILSVGRFFDEARGHSKRQMEMVEAFGRLVSEGLSGWELHLVGGCLPEDAAYLDAVRRRAEGLPVHVHTDASGPALDELYSRASLFWHAAGLGVDVRTRPEAHEHFGIAVVEAMSAGVVPVVHGTGGPASTVRDGRDGVHFGALDELVAATARLARDPDRRSALAVSAVARSAEFDEAELRKRLGVVLARVGA